jgi:proteasome activator subunit 4
MVPVLTSFLPPTHTHLYLSSLFKIWEAFNSAVIDDRLIRFAGELSEEHVAGKFGLAGEEGGAERKDIGMWTEREWALLIGKGLGSMSSYCLCTSTTL